MDQFSIGVAVGLAIASLFWSYLGSLDHRAAILEISRHCDWLREQVKKQSEVGEEWKTLGDIDETPSD